MNVCQLQYCVRHLNNVAKPHPTSRNTHIRQHIFVKYKESIKQNQEFKYLSHSVLGTKRDSHRLKTHNNEHVDLA